MVKGAAKARPASDTGMEVCLESDPLGKVTRRKKDGKPYYFKKVKLSIIKDRIRPFTEGTLFKSYDCFALLKGSTPMAVLTFLMATDPELDSFVRAKPSNSFQWTCVDDDNEETVDVIGMHQEIDFQYKYHEAALHTQLG